MSIVKLFPDMQLHLAGWQCGEEERIPHSPCYWYAEILQSYSAGREQGGFGAHRKESMFFLPIQRNTARGGRDRE